MITGPFTCLAASIPVQLKNNVITNQKTKIKYMYLHFLIQISSISPWSSGKSIFFGTIFLLNDVPNIWRTSSSFLAFPVTNVIGGCDILLIYKQF